MRATLVTATALSAALTLGVGPVTSEAKVAADEHDFYLTFNGKTGETPSLKSSGSASVSTEIASANGGTVTGVRHQGAGRAARFEPFDGEAPAKLAAVVVTPDGGKDPFAPGSSGFTFGAAFRIDAKSQGSKVDNGNNLAQRGLYQDDAQYKLQVDDNRLSCRVKGAAGSILVRADEVVKPRRWHRARCTRKGSTVTLVFVERTSDGRTKHRWSRSGTIGKLAFDSRPPLSIGGKVNGNGKLVATSSDQFNGRIDNVFFRRLGG